MATFESIAAASQSSWVLEYSVDWTDAVAFPSSVDFKAGATLSDGTITWDKTTNIQRDDGTDGTAGKGGVDLTSGTGLVVVGGAGAANGCLFVENLNNIIADYDTRDRIFCVTRMLSGGPTADTTSYHWYRPQFSIGAAWLGSTSRQGAYIDRSGAASIAGINNGPNLTQSQQKAALSLANMRYIGIEFMAGAASRLLYSGSADWPTKPEDMTLYTVISSGANAGTSLANEGEWTAANTKVILSGFFDLSGTHTMTMEGWRIYRSKAPTS